MRSDVGDWLRGVVHASLPAIMRMSDASQEWFGRDSWRSSPSFSTFVEAGIHNVVSAYGVTPEGLGYALAAPLAQAVEGAWRPELKRWMRLRAHLLAGIRLHPSPQKEDAVLTAAGKVVHAEREARSASARDALREAAERIDRARSRRGRSDPDAALEAWQGLVSGRWSLVDQFDRDGRRYVIARRNDPVLESPRSLTPQERQVLAYATFGRSNKEIAYELGLSVSTVSSHLSNAAKRLKIDTRTAFATCSVLREAGASPRPEDA